MTAGRGVSHSERTHPEDYATGQTLHGLQMWLELPAAIQDCDPSFDAFAAEDIPTVDTVPGVVSRVVSGTAFGVSSPVCGPDFLFVDSKFKSRLPLGDVGEAGDELGVFVVSGSVTAGGEAIPADTLAIVPVGDRPELQSHGPDPAHVVVFGGPPIDAPRHMWWNFAHTSKEAVEEAKKQWVECVAKGFPEGAAFSLPPGENDALPLPEPRPKK